MLAPFSKSFENSVLSLSVSRLNKEIVMKLVINVEIWNIVAHIAFKFYPGTSGTFSTGSTTRITGPAQRHWTKDEQLVCAGSGATASSAASHAWS